MIEAWNDIEFGKVGVTVDVLRLDLLHPMISGNKWLKLKAYAWIADSERKKGILTLGGPWSNHVHAAAFLCHEIGLECHLWIRGRQEYLTKTLADCRLWNARLRFLNRTEFSAEAVAREFADANDLLYIPMGGADSTGLAGVENYLQSQSLPQYSHAACSVGTGTTFGGFAFFSENFPNVTGIDAGTNDRRTAEKIDNWQLQIPAKKLRLETAYSLGGFAKYDSLLPGFMNELYRETRIPTDIVYTGKLFFAVKRMLLESYFPQGAKLLIIHSGGLQGNRSLEPGLLQF